MDYCPNLLPLNDTILFLALILARAPNEFTQRYLPELLIEHKEEELPLRLKIDFISAELFTPLLRFWYTASYDHNNNSNDLVSPSSSILSEQSIMTPTTSSPISSPMITSNNDIQFELEEKSIELGTALLPLHCDNIPDFIQLVSDLRDMREQAVATDVTIHLMISTPDVKSSTTRIASFKAHRFILAAQSSYFYALFCKQFQESNRNSVHLTDDLFNPAIIDLLLNFLYTDKIIVKPLQYDTTKASSPLQRRLAHNKHALRVIQKAYYAVDYLGHSDTLGQALLVAMETMCHQFKCVCPECAILLPSMLAWSDKHVEMVPKLRRKLILLYSDPVLSLSTLWSQRPFSLLITSLVPSAATLGEETLASVLKLEPLFRERTPKTLVHEIEERTFYNVTKHNAIHVLHSLHLCLSQIRSANVQPTWSRPTLDLVNPILRYTVDMVSHHFDFYCVEYPILLSCVDGIGAGFSIDFLDFLLRHVLNGGITIENAGVIYQGIVRDLVGRQEVVNNLALDDVLIQARTRCGQYIGKHWTKVKAQGGFNTLDKSTLRQLSEDINIPYRSLTRPFDTDFSTIFSFKPKKSKKMDKNTLLTEGYTRRLSLGGFIRSNSHNDVALIRSRPRALSTESAFLASSTERYHDLEPATVPVLENPPLIHLLSHETEQRTRTMQQGQSTYNTLHSVVEYRRPLLRTSSSFNSLTDQLLPVETMVVVRPPSISESASTGTERPTRLKFELPTTPARSKSPLPPTYLSPQNTKNRHRRGSKSRRSRWSRGSNNSDISDDEELVPAVGSKVELLRRPLPTMGTIKYIGPVQFAQGQYIGVELESRCKYTRDMST